MNEYLNEEGKVITEKEILASAKESGITPEEVISLFNLKLKTEDSGNTLGAAVKTADVAPEVIADTDLTLENGSSELQETEPKPRRGRAQVRQEELKRRKDATWSENFASNVISDSFKDLSSDQLLEIKEKAANELVVNNSNVEYSFNDADIEAEALKIFNEKVLPVSNVNQGEEGLGKAYMRALEIGFNNVGSMLSSIPETVYNVFAIPQNVVAALTGDESWATDSDNFKKNFNIENKLLTHYNEEIAELSKEQEKFKQKKFEGKTGVYENFEEGNFTEGFTLLGLGLAESAPVSIAMMAGGAVAGSTARLAATTTPFFMEQARAELKEEDPEMSAAELTFKSIGIAGAETVFSAISNKSLTNAYKDIIRKEGVEVGSKVFKDGLVKMYTTALKKYGSAAGMIGEGIEEVATQMTQNAIKGKNITEGASDAFLLGLGGGTVYSSPMSIKQAKDYATTKIATNKVNDIIIADGKVKNINLAFDKAMSEPVTAAQISIVDVKNADKALLKNLKVGVKEGSITQEQAAQSIAKFNQTKQIADQVEKTNLNLNIDKKTEVVNLLSEKINLQKQIKGVDESLASAQKQRINEIDDAIKATTQEASKVKLQEETKVVEKLIGKEKVKSFKTVEEFVKETGSRPDADAFIDKSGNVFINTQRASEVGAFSAASHELLHRVIKSTFSDKVASTNLVKNFNKVLEKEGYLDVVQKRIDDNYRYNEDGSEKAFEEYAEEYLTSFSDAIATGAIEFNESKFKKFMQPIVDFLRKVGYSKIEFKDGRDVYNFVKDYQKNIQKGELSKRAQALQTKGEQVAEDISKPSVSKINQQIEQLETEYEQGEVDFDAYEQQLANLEAKLKRAKAKPIEEVKKPRAKEDKQDVKQLGDALNKLIPENTTNKEYKEKVVGTVAAELSGKTLNPLIKKIAAGYGVVADNVYGKSWDDFYTAVKGVQFIKNLQKFNPEINDDFGGFVIGSQYGIRNRVKEALGKFKKEGEGGFKEDVSVAKDIAAAEPTVAPVVDKPKYKNLVQQKVLSTDGLKTVRDKVISSVRVLKSRFDAVVTKNVSVPPIIAEIKKDIGKQADIVFKKEMGGIKNNELQNYLKTNKKAILENMTTFYLTKSFPEAIQKSVGGKYLLDKDGKRVINDFGDATFVPNFVNSDVWKGAKIDREKTSTEAKGKTSGNEIIRRVPNVNQAISDELFLSKFIGADGKPIRGRKESLAKAMGEEIAFDIINQDLKTDGPISEALKNNQEALGVVITENFEEDMSRQIERGNIKFSISKEIQVGVDILVDNKFDQFSEAFVEWYENSPKNIKDEWDNYWSIPFNKISAGVRTVFTNPKFKEDISELKEFQKYFDQYADNVTNKKEGLKELGSFSEKLAKLIPAELFKIPGVSKTFLGFHSRYIKSSNPLRKSIENSLNEKIDDPNFDAVLAVKDDIFVVSPGNKLYKDILNWQANSKGTAQEKAQEFKNEFGEKLKNAKKANTVLFEYLNSKAFEVLAKNESLIPGYLRWLESNTNIGNALKSLAVPVGIQLFDSNQAIYLDKNGKGYIKQNREKSLELNTNHPQYKEALAAQKEASEKAWEKASKKTKEAVTKNKFFLQRANTSLGINTYLQPKGEHQKSVGGATIALAKNTLSMLSLLKKNPKAIDNVSALLTILNSEALLDFNQTINAKYVSDIQDAVLGETNPLLEGRLSALDNKNKSSIYFADGIDVYKKSADAINKVITNLDPEAIAKNAQARADLESEALDPSVKFSLSKEFNNIIERNKDVAADVTYSKIVAKRMGANIGKYKFYLPSSAEDFRLLTGYTFSGKGKQGTKDMAWFDKNLIRPYTVAIAAIDVAKQTTKNDFKALNKAMPKVARTIGDLIPTKDYTNDQAVRVYLWNKAGYKVPGLNEKEVGNLVAYVAGNPELAAYAESLVLISKTNEWLKPTEHWDVETILSDINNLTEKGGRKVYLAEWIENADAIFSEQNMNKIEALYGKRHREALEDSLYRMKNGTNRPSGSNAQVNRWNNWLNNSIGSIMFFNRRSALLQMLSTSNFLNWSDNNPIKAGAAFANQKQYWKDFSTLFNSDKLKQRRGGLRADVNEAEIASAAANSRNKAAAALSWLLKKGFTPTQIADSFAIASGGATFYRNRINTYLNQKDAEGNNLYTEKQAEDKAFLDFIEVSDQSQQSSDPSLVSMEQASILGRLVLAFQNTTQQYSRIMKRSALDIIKRRQVPGTTSMLQSDFSNFSKIMYYGAIQNIIFNGLSAAIFALIPGFGEEEEKDVKAKSKIDKTKRILNGSVDSLLRGMGVRGAVVAQVKNTIAEYFKQKDKGFRADHAYTIIQAVNLSPPIGSKVKKIYSAITGYKYGEELMKQRGFDLTAAGRLNLSPSYAVLGSLASGIGNVPLDRMYAEIQGVAEMLDERNTIYQRLALSLGFRSWDVNAKNEEDDLIKSEIKETRAQRNKQKNKVKRAETAKQKIINRRKAYESLDDRTQIYVANLNKNARKKFLDKIAKQLKQK